MKLFLTKRGIKDKNGPAAGPGHRWRLPGVGSGGVSFRTKVLLWLKKLNYLKVQIFLRQKTTTTTTNNNISSARVLIHSHTHGSLYQSLNSTTRKYVLNPGRHPRKNCQSYEKQIIVTYTNAAAAAATTTTMPSQAILKKEKNKKMQNLREKITNTNYLEQNGNQRVKKHCLLYNTHLNHVPLCVFFQMLLLFFSCLLFVFGFH